MAYEQILYRVEDHVATITLNRPDRLNAWTGRMHHEVKTAMRAAADDAQARVIVLTGAGRGFCAGADMAIPCKGIPAGNRSAPGRGKSRSTPTPIPAFRRPVLYFPSGSQASIIAAINGACAGLGFVIALYADIRIASDAAVFTTSFSRRGLVAEHGVSWLLPRLIGIAQAADLLYSARRVSAREAAEIGLVNRVFAFDVFEAEVAAYAAMLANEVSPRSLREIKREMWNGQFQSLGEAIESANADMPASFTSEDFKEGVAHYVERRAPAFTGR